MNNTAIKVLLIEDNLQDADLIMRMLNRTVNGNPLFSVRHVQRLSDGLAGFGNSYFNIILLDLGLPDSRGIDTLRKVHDKDPGAPIIVLTGLDDQEIATQAIRFGGQDYLIKGQIDGRLLVRSIRYAIERKRAEEALRENEERYRALIKASSQVLYRMSPDWSEMRQLQGGSFIADTEKPNRNWLREYIHPDDQTRVLKIIGDAVRTGTVFELEHRVRRVDGTLGWTFSRAVPVRNAAGAIVEWFGAAIDVTERKRMEEEIKHMAHHDPLTGLPNRRFFYDVANLEIAQARRHATKLAIFFMDLDRFKEVNDTLGHDIGDLLLRETASRLKAVTRTSDTVARIGGDEFNLVISDIVHSEYGSEVALKILAAIRKPFFIKGHELNLSTTIGISIFPDDSEKIDELLKYADIAMYYAKENGRNMFQFYSPVINTRSLERVRFENTLRRALRQDELRLYFQPLVDVKTERIVSVEALVRWQHPERGVLLPVQFFEAAEDIGLMPEIEEWVLTNLSTQVRVWLDQGPWPVCVTVNVSARQFQKSAFVSRISRILDETGLQPGCLDLEITEATAMQNVENSIVKIKELRDIGVQVSIDDFGCGYSSLNHLKRLPVQKLKIDRSFIRDIATNADDRKIVTAVLLLAHSLDLKVVAEGVEDEEQLDFLRSLQCDEAQGNLFSEPLPAEELKTLVGT